MRILQICTHFSINYPGGITKYVKTLSQSLTNKGVHVDIISGDTNDKMDNIQFYTYKPQRVRPYSLGYIEGDTSLIALFDFIKNNKYDLIHIHATGDLPMAFYREINNLGVKYIVSLHDYYLICPRIFMINKNEEICHSVNLEKCSKCIGLFENNDTLFRIARKLNLKLPTIPSDITKKRLSVIQPFLENASLLLPVSQKVYEIFSQLIPNANYQVCHIGNETAYEKSVVQTTSQNIRLTFLGTLNKHKGEDVLEYILRNLNEEQNIEINFYGRASKQAIKKLKQYNIGFKGSYQPSDLKDIMKNTDMGLVLPIWEDNAPQVVMEFLNYGVPIIGTKRGGIPDFVTHLENGYLFDPDNLEQMKKLIDWIKHLQPSTIKELKTNIRKLKTPDEHTEEIETIYKKVLGG